MVGSAVHRVDIGTFTGEINFRALHFRQEDDNVLWVAAPHHGLGGNMHILSVALTHAYTHGKALGIVGEVRCSVRQRR